MNFSKSDWINYCEKINAKDNSPKNRDESRAFYDSVRDIESFKNGYKLIRIKHGEYDWESPDAETYIDEIMEKLNSKKIERHKIARIVLNVDGRFVEDPLNKHEFNDVIKKFVNSFYPDYKFEIIITPGRFLSFEWPQQYIGRRLNTDANSDILELFYEAANKVIIEYIKFLPQDILSLLQKTADYITYWNR